MSLDRSEERPEGLYQLKLGDRVDIDALGVRLTRTFSLNELMQASLDGRAAKITITVSPYEGNSFEVIVLNGQASVIETNGTFENDAESVTHNLYVGNSTSTLKLVPKIKPPFSVSGIQMKVEQMPDSLRDSYKSLLKDKERVEAGRQKIRRGCLGAFAGTLLAAGAYCAGAYELFNADGVEEAQKAE